MAALIFEPLAAHLHFSLPDSPGISKWAEILTQFLETLAKLCRNSGPCLIGHIKGLALLGDSSYVRLSVISASLPAQIETNASGDFSEMTVTVNMLVYGLPRKTLEGILEGTAALPCSPWSGKVTVKPVPASIRGDHAHNHLGC